MSACKICNRCRRYVVCCVADREVVHVMHRQNSAPPHVFVGSLSDAVLPTQRLHALAGSPAFDGAGEMHGRCWICAGVHARGILIGKWQAASYTDQNKARCQDATHVCEPCAWACSWVVPPGFPPPEPGKKGLNLRLFSHFHDARGYLALNKASKPAILKWLREPKVGEWFAAIADTGQKHVLPWTPINVTTTGGVVRFEECNVTLPRDGHGWRVVDRMIALLSLGVTKGEIESGDYYPRTWQQHADALREFEHEFDMRRSSQWFGLALWLSQRDEEIYETGQQRARETAKACSRSDSSDPRAVPLGVSEGSADALGLRDAALRSAGAPARL